MSYAVSFDELKFFLGCYPAVQQYHSFGMKSTRLLRHDGNSVRAIASGNLSQAATQENVLDWVKQDKRRMLHVVYRVGDLDRTIKYVQN